MSCRTFLKKQEKYSEAAAHFLSGAVVHRYLLKAAARSLKTLKYT